LRRVVDGVEGDAKQHEIAAEPLADLAEIAGEAEAVIRQGRAGGVDEGDGHHFAGEFGERNAAAGLVGVGEIGDRVAWVDCGMGRLEEL